VLERDLELIRSSVFFDEHWYLANYRDIASAGIDAAEHYLHAGAREGRDPSSNFSTSTYLSRHPELQRSGENPLLYFLRQGLSERLEEIDAAGVSFRLDDRIRLCNGTRSDSRSMRDGPLIVFVTHDMNVGGAPVVLMNIGRWFKEHTHFRVKFISLGGGPLHSQFRNIAPTHIVGTVEIPDDWVPGAQNSLREFLGDEPAIIFSNSIASGDFIKISPKTTPMVFYIHEMARILDKFPAQLAQIKSRAEHVICGSSRVFTDLRARGFSQDVLSVREAFVSEDDVGTAPSITAKLAAREALGLPQDSSIVVACGVAHWRKQPLLFVKLAAELYRNKRRDAYFYWVGDGEDAAAMRVLADQLHLGDRLKVVGFKEDFKLYISAADVFALPSIEDPFPLVCLHAALAGVPCVVFREATGLTELLEPKGDAPAGIAVPLGDDAAFYNAVDRLLRDGELRKNLGEVARSRTIQRYTTSYACQVLLQIVRRVAKISPKVSVVVPNFNCGPYLAERLESIQAQSFQDLEILLLDDCSTDGSAEILKAFAAENPSATLMLADRNGGSVFAAWERGIEASTGEIIWLAEADDFCAPDFLSHALEAFAVRGTHLVHGRSIPVDASGEIAGDWNDLYLDRICPGRWRSSFTAPAAGEVNRTLGVANSIPNASAVLVLNQAARKSIKLAKAFRLAGDWAFYLGVAAGGRISYVHEAVNYHRRHDKTVTNNLEGSRLYFQELANVGALVSWLYGPNSHREDRFDEFVKAEASRFEFTSALPKGILPSELFSPRRPGILYGVGDLSGGGAQMFAARFVNAWADGFAPAVLVSMGHEPDHPALLAQIAPNVPVLTRGEVESVGIKALMEDWGLDAIVTGHWWADRQMGYWLDREPNHPWTVVMHGCYENLLAQPDAFPGYRDDLAAIERNCDCFVWTADKNLQVFRQGLLQPKRLEHVVNGYSPILPTENIRRKLGIESDAVVFTLASRAIESKGWLVTLNAFEKLRSLRRRGPEIHLLLVGDGPVADQIRGKQAPEGVHIVPHTARLADYIAASDVCVLPSWFPGESLPLVLIEFLAQGKPAVVSDIGMCPWAIDAGGTKVAAGVVVPRNPASGKVEMTDLAAAMSQFVGDPALSRRLERAAYRAFKKFSMSRMLEQYDRILSALVKKPSNTKAPEPHRNGLAVREADTR